MFSTAKLHPSLDSLLRFEEQRLGIPIEVLHKPLDQCTFYSPPGPVIQIRIHTGSTPQTLPVVLPDVAFEVCAPFQPQSDIDHVGFTDAEGQFRALAGVTETAISAYVDLHHLFVEPDCITAQSEGDGIPGNPAMRIADFILSQALALAVRNLRKKDWKKEAAAYATATLAASDEEVRQSEQKIRNNERTIEERSWEVQSLAAKNAELREQVRLSRLITRKRRERRAKEEHANLQRLVGRSLRRVDIVDGALKCLTGPIEVEYCGMRYEFGCFFVEIPLGKGRLTITPEDQSHEVEGYSHPHLASDGAPCLGNAGSSIAQLRGEGKHFECVTLLLEFLRSYNPDNPYLRIERWDPDWQDEDDRYDSCYDEASLSDCASCGDIECHHRAGARRRCYEHTDTNDCIECAGCNRRRGAIDRCRGEHAPEECATCETNCTFAGDVEACFASHAGENCAECPNEDCNHHEENHNETNR